MYDINELYLRSTFTVKELNTLLNISHNISVVLNNRNTMSDKTFSFVDDDGITRELTNSREYHNARNGLNEVLYSLSHLTSQWNGLAFFFHYFLFYSTFGLEHTIITTHIHQKVHYTKLLQILVVNY